MDSPRRRPEVVLHIGTGKTGTTSIQVFLRKNRQRLAEYGVLFPRTPGAERHFRLGLAVTPDDRLLRSPAWRRTGATDPAEFRRTVWRRLAREIREAGPRTVLLSDEALFGAPDSSLEELRRLCERMAGPVRVLVYLRRQDDHLISRYQQVVKTGSVERLGAYVDREFASTYDYHARLSRWREIVGPHVLVVRPFEPAQFVGGSLHQDFLAAAGVDVAVGALEPVGRRNDSLDAESVELLRVLNLHRIEHHGARAGLIDNRSLYRRLIEHSSGPALTLPAEVLDRFMRRWQASNVRVAREFCHTEDGHLFRAPRRTSGTTTVQRLDPARLDHYFELLGVPEDEHEKIRRIAEREAARG